MYTSRAIHLDHKQQQYKFFIRYKGYAVSNSKRQRLTLKQHKVKFMLLAVFKLCMWCQILKILRGRWDVFKWSCNSSGCGKFYLSSYGLCVQLDKALQCGGHLCAFRIWWMCSKLIYLSWLSCLRLAYLFGILNALTNNFPELCDLLLHFKWYVSLKVYEGL